MSSTVVDIRRPSDAGALELMCVDLLTSPAAGLVPGVPVPVTALDFEAAFQMRLVAGDAPCGRESLVALTAGRARMASSAWALRKSSPATTAEAPAEACVAAAGAYLRLWWSFHVRCARRSTGARCDAPIAFGWQCEDFLGSTAAACSRASTSVRASCSLAFETTCVALLSVSARCHAARALRSGERAVVHLRLARKTLDWLDAEVAPSFARPAGLPTAFPRAAFVLAPCVGRALCVALRAQQLVVAEGGLVGTVPSKFHVAAWLFGAAARDMLPAAVAGRAPLVAAWRRAERACRAVVWLAAATTVERDVLEGGAAVSMALARRAHAAATAAASSALTAEAAWACHHYARSNHATTMGAIVEPSRVVVRFASSEARVDETTRVVRTSPSTPSAVVLLPIVAVPPSGLRSDDATVTTERTVTRVRLDEP